MIELTGKYTDCKIFSDNVEQEAISQVYSFLNHPAFKDCKTRFMPDIHAGAGAVIGTTVELSDKIIPNVIGVDIGCGMLSYKLNAKDIDFADLDNYITVNIPSGFSIRQKEYPIDNDFACDLLGVCKTVQIEPDRVFKSIGTLGGGNHFIEVGKDEEDSLWLTIHTGSRNFGLQVAKYYQLLAKKEDSIDLSNIPLKERETYKRQAKSKKDTIPSGMEYLTGDLAVEYLRSMRVAQRFAIENRHAIASDIYNHIGGYSEQIESVHNYISLKDNMIRKGAISAHKDELVIIPWNMRDGLIIGKGKGNPDWNYSAPHGAGRNMSRSKAKEMIGLEEFQESMQGIYSTSVCKSTIDESPMAYKDHNEIEHYLSETVEIMHRVKPIYNFKAK